jgi:bifunctional non-homologous end joining protein LigD
VTKDRSVVRVGGRVLAISNLDKVLWPEQGYTKGDLIAYYQAVAPSLLPYLKDRPVSLERYPDGVNRPGFFEKNAPPGLPRWVKTITLASDGPRARIRYILCNDTATLAYLANLAAITLHVWMSRAGSLDRPDFVLFDLDTGDGCTLGTLATVALAVRDALRSRRLTGVVKTTGGSGLHVFVWTTGRYTYERAKRLTHDVALQVQTALPDLVTLERRVAKRPPGRVYLDWVQMGRGKTVVMPFTVRARDQAPVSMPLSWEQVEKWRRSRVRDTAAYFARWNIANVPGLLHRRGDPWRVRGTG